MSRGEHRIGELAVRAAAVRAVRGARGDDGDDLHRRGASQVVNTVGSLAALLQRTNMETTGFSTLSFYQTMATSP